MRFRIITDSWIMTDRRDARNMAKALWVFFVTGEFGIPTVYKPNQTIRAFRRFPSLRRMNAHLGLVPRCVTTQARQWSGGRICGGNIRNSVSTTFADRRHNKIM